MKSMRHPLQALAWHFWAVNRRGWLLILSAIPLCACLAQFGSASLRSSEVAHAVGTMAMVFSMLLMLALCDFTDRDSRGGFAGFPRRLFLMPVSTALLVMSPMLCAV